MYYGDDWPKMADGSDFDGQYLFRLLKEGQSPFRAAWDVNLLLEEIEQNLNAKVTGIPLVSKGANQYIEILEKSAAIRSSLFNYNVSLDFASLWLRERLFEQKPLSFPIPVAPTREFCVTLFTSKIEATIRNVGDMIGWEEDELTVGPLAAAAKASLLRFIPHMLPADEPQLYRLVLDHGDFGIHNMTIDLVNDHPHITSLFDWERGCIVPAILSDPELAVIVDLVTDEKANPSVTRVPKDATSEDHELHKTWTQTPRNGSPIPGLCAADILEGCECILHPTTTTHKPSAYKSTSASTMKTTKKPRQSRIPRPYPTRGPEPETTMTNGPTMTDETSSQPASITMMDSSTSTISFVCPALPTQMVSVSGECCNYENTAIANFTNVYSGPHTHVNAGKVYNSTTFAVDLPGSSLAYECAQFVIQNQDPLEFGGFDLYYNASTPERWDCVVYEMRYSHPYDAVSDDLLCSYGFEETYFVEEGG
ncbi:hypothetical protein ANO11243_070390 [Dothideomycetidae sp. 11243]|nr:hypothetical protein ANO11243_070390 [fungal sp. No.11243]